MPILRHKCSFRFQPWQTTEQSSKNKTDRLYILHLPNCKYIFNYREYAELFQGYQKVKNIQQILCLSTCMTLLWTLDSVFHFKV